MSSTTVAQAAPVPATHTLHTAAEYIEHADHTELVAFARSLEDPMPADLTERIINALKEEVQR